MPLNPALVGKAYPALHYEVGREKLREFASAVGEHDPLYHDEAVARAAGHPDLPAFPTFPIVMSYRAGQVIYGDPELGLDYAHVLHGEQEFSFDRPVYAGDRLVIVGTVASVEAKGRHEVLVVSTAMSTEDGEPVCATRSTLISVGTAVREHAGTS